MRKSVNLSRKNVEAFLEAVKPLKQQWNDGLITAYEFFTKSQAITAALEGKIRDDS